MIAISVVFHKPRGQFFEYFDPLSPLRTILLNKVYVIIWIFGKNPPPAMTTWFMNDPSPSFAIFVLSQSLLLLPFFGKIAAAAPQKFA